MKETLAPDVVLGTAVTYLDTNRYKVFQIWMPLDGTGRTEEEKHKQHI